MRTITAFILVLSMVFASEANAQESRDATIRMHSSDDCGPCREWWLKSREAWEKVGWRVEKIFDLNGKRGLPWFDIRDGDGLRFEVDGPLTREKFLAARKARLAKRQSVME